MSTGPTMGELTDFIRENLPRGFVMRIRFTAGYEPTVYLYDRFSRVVENQAVDSDDLPAVFVRWVNAAREMDGLEPVEGTWDE